ncbi:DHHC palmitoyltransferase-domain-containing protein [Chlamydoabsidia padenii]|nr:DHHC palmitoyltransferase-domain-containing protein [Chlamydoabsidia padenii]
MLDSIPGRVFVVGVILLICTIAYSSQYFILIPALQDSFTLSTLYVLGPFNICVLLVFYNYFLAVTTDPGRVPPDWEAPSSLKITTHSSPPRYCKSCQHYKPPRTHHCRYCRRCVLKMDHHCPWINNCVGIANYPHFLRFAALVNISCTYVLALLVWRTRCIMHAIRYRFDGEPNTTEVIFIVLNFALATIVLFCVGILGGYHFYCVARNQSSIEACERDKVETMIRRGKIPPFEYPFDLGVYKNICSVLGNNPLLWLWPNRQNTTCDGLSYPVQPHIDPQTQYFWPPKDPDDLRPSIFSSRYKRQQEKRQQQDDDSEDYYDSGSFATDSEDDYSLTDEEQHMRKFVSDSVYNLAGISTDDGPHHRLPRTDDSPTNTPSTTKHLYRSSPSFNRTPQLYHPGDSSDNDDDDTIPLSSLVNRTLPVMASKPIKED